MFVMILALRKAKDQKEPNQFFNYKRSTQKKIQLRKISLLMPSVCVCGGGGLSALFNNEKLAYLKASIGVRGISF